MLWRSSLPAVDNTTQAMLRNDFRTS